MNENNEMIRMIKMTLKARQPKAIENVDPNYRHASVLVPLFESDGEYQVLFTKRTQQVEEHKGQISFPGGGVEEEDQTLEETALREAFEEVGLKRGDVSILGQLDDTPTAASRFIIHPFVGLIPFPYPFNLNAVEVKRIINIPLDFFAEPSHHFFRRDGYVGPSYEYDGDVIWGATARIMEHFMKLLETKISLPLGEV
jgi:8-oxo-dGTP pyrophosphatase MutT (NUDIX family)